MRPRLLTAILAASLGAAACQGESAPLFGSSSAGAGGAASGSSTTSGGAGGAAPTCDPASAKTACDTCVYAVCCAEAGRCGPGTGCDAFTTCARTNGCLGAPDALPCAAKACPTEATSEAVADFQALGACVRASCDKPCGL